MNQHITRWKASARYLSELLLSPSFLKQMRKVLEVTLNFEREAGFAIGRSITTNQLCYGNVVDSGDDPTILSPEVNLQIGNISSQSIEGRFGGRGDFSMIPLLQLHTHPRISFYPSAQDMRSLFSKREYTTEVWDIDYYPIEAIAAMQTDSRNCKLDVLLLQEASSDEPRGPVAGEAAQSWLENTLPRELEDDHCAIASALKRAPFVTADVLTYKCRMLFGKITIERDFTKQWLLGTMKQFSY